MNNDDKMKEIDDVLEAFKVFLRVFGEVMEDGKIDISDIYVVFKAFGKMGVMLEAFKGCEKIPFDIAQMSDAEKMQVGLKFIMALGEFKGERR